MSSSNILLRWSFLLVYVGSWYMDCVSAVASSVPDRRVRTILPAIPPNRLVTPPIVSSSETKRSTTIKNTVQLPPRLSNICTVVDHANVAYLSYYSIHDIIKNLSKTKHNIRITQRKLTDVGATYLIVQYTHEREDVEVHRIIALAGSRNTKNWQQNSDMNLETDDFLKSAGLLDRAHRGYLTVYRAILADFLSEEKRLTELALGDVTTNVNEGDATMSTSSSSSLPPNVLSYTATSSRNVSAVPPSLSRSLSITGHSLGGAVSVLLALGLKGQGYNIEQVTIFGSPKFTDKKGAEQIAQSNLRISRFEHVNDPAVFSPIALPQPEKIAMGLTVGRSVLGGFAGMAAGTLAGIAMTDLYADLDKSSLILIEKVEKPTEKATEKPIEKSVEKASILAAGDKSNELTEFSIPPISSSNGISLPQSGSVTIPFVGNAGTALSMLVGVGGVDGNNVNHGPHRFFVGKDANIRSQIVPRLRDLQGVDWKWHSMHVYHDLLKNYRDQYFLQIYHEQQQLQQQLQQQQENQENMNVNSSRDEIL